MSTDRIVNPPAFACELCGLGPADGVTTYRTNPKGEKGVWRCDSHVEKTPPDDVKELVEAITMSAGVSVPSLSDLALWTGHFLHQEIQESIFITDLVEGNESLREGFARFEDRLVERVVEHILAQAEPAKEQPPEEIIEIDDDGTVRSLGRAAAEPAGISNPPDVRIDHVLDLRRACTIALECFGDEDGPTAKDALADIRDACDRYDKASAEPASERSGAR